MAFCKYCGRQLIEDEVCTCVQQASQTAANEAAANTETLVVTPASGQVFAPTTASESVPTDTPASVAVTEPVKANSTASTIYLDKAKDILKNVLALLKAPGTAGQSFVETADKIDGIYLIAAQAILSSLLAMICLGKLNSYFSMFGALVSQYKFNLFVGFIVTLLFSLLFSAIFTGILFAGCKIVKLPITIEKALLFTTLRSIAAIPFILLGGLLILLNPIVGIFIFYMSTFLSLCFVLIVFSRIYPEHSNKTIYLIFSVFFVFIILSVSIMSKTFTLYISSSLKNIMNGGIMDFLRYL